MTNNKLTQEKAGHALELDAPVGPAPSHAIPHQRRLTKLVKLGPTPVRNKLHDSAYEKMLLGAIMIEPDKVMSFLFKKGFNFKAFQDPARRKLYRLITRLTREKKPIDAIILSEESTFDTAELSDYIAECPTWTHGPWYAERLMDSHQRRALSPQLTDLAEAIQTDDVPIDRIQSHLAEMADDLRSAPTTSLKVTALPELKRVKSGEDPNELLKSRYLTIGGSILLIAQTGVGKSSFIMQAAMTWALGEPFFGIQPARPLRTIICQAENDDGDMAEMRDGVMASLHLTPAETTTVETSIDTFFDNSHTGERFADILRGVLTARSYDLLVIDPANAYHGGDSGQQKDATHFLRNLINPILTEYGIGLILVHHSAKPSKTEKTFWKGGDWAYLGAGSAEWANWARGIINIEAVGDVYRLRLPKRAQRIGWTNGDGEPAYERFIAHAKEPDQIYWREADPDEIPDTSDLQEPRRPGRPVTVKPAIESYVPLATEIVKAKPIQVTLFRAAIERLVFENTRLGRSDGRALFDFLTTKEDPVLFLTKKRVGLAQFIGLKNAISKIENDQISLKLKI